MGQETEFTTEDAYPYNRSNAVRWIISHLWRYKWLLVTHVSLVLFCWATYTSVPVAVGKAAEEILNPTGGNALLRLALTVLFLYLSSNIVSSVRFLFHFMIPLRFTRDIREELYVSLLGKSQTFHDRQRVGEIMARATDDVNQLYQMASNGLSRVLGIVLGFSLPTIHLAAINLQLLLMPLLFIAVFAVTVRRYRRRLEPVIKAQRKAFGVMTAGLEETLSGIETVKAGARESYERARFRRNARRFRDHFARQGRVEALYVPDLIYRFALGLVFLHGFFLFRQGALTIGEVVAVIGLARLLRYQVMASVWSLSLIQLGVASAERILDVINTSAGMDGNPGGESRSIRGEIVFDDVSFGYGDNLVLENVSFDSPERSLKTSRPKLAAGGVPGTGAHAIEPKETQKKRALAASGQFSSLPGLLFPRCQLWPCFSDNGLSAARCSWRPNRP